MQDFYRRRQKDTGRRLRYCRLTEPLPTVGQAESSMLALTIAEEPAPTDGKTGAATAGLAVLFTPFSAVVRLAGRGRFARIGRSSGETCGT